MMKIQIQVKFSLEKIQLVKRNESAWNYLRVSNCAIKKVASRILLTLRVFWMRAQIPNVPKSNEN